ncbi:MAG: high-potential iron-sulfur protein [Steroidobacteraceae bacterium]
MSFIARRRLLRALALAATISAPRWALAAAAARTPLDEKEPAARTIDYVADAKTVNVGTHPTYKRGQSCTTCSFIEFGSGRQRGCSIVPGRLVNAAGWCKLWKLRGSR